jgi:hypothetical protein
VHLRIPVLRVPALRIQFLRIHAAVFCLAIIPAASVAAQTPSGLGCTVKKGYYRCNQVAFTKYLEEAKTAAIETQPFNRVADKALSDLGVSLGKTKSSEAADLTFVLMRTDAVGIVYGPADGELASLSIYSRGPQGGRGDLIWIEAYYGEPDMAWPAVVHLLIQQFKEDIK